MNVLYLISRGHRSPAFVQHVLKNKPSKVFLCVVDYGCENTLKKISDILSQQNVPWETVNFLKLFNENGFRYKADFLRYIYDLGNREVGSHKTWKEFYKLPGENFSAWWLSLVYEKNPYKSDVYSKWTKVRTIIALQKTYHVDQIWIDPHLAEIETALKHSSLKTDVVSLARPSLKSHLKRSLFLIFLIELIRTIKLAVELACKIVLLKVCYFSFRHRSARLKKSEFLLLTMFPLLDEDALGEGKFVNRAYGPLQNAISQKATGAISWLAMFTGTGIRELANLIKMGREVIRSGENLFFYEEFLGLRGLLKVFSCYVLFFFKTTFNLPQIRRQFEYSVDGVSVDFWNLWKKDVVSSFAGKELCLQLSFYFSFPPVLSQLPKGANVLYFSEMHSWDHALNANIQKYKNLTSVGLQHTIVPLLLMNYFPDPRELRGVNDFTGHLPLPHLLGCSGEITSQILLKSGWDLEKIFILGAFRFQSICEKLKRSPVPRSARKNQVVVALTISDLENKEILSLLYDAFNDKDCNVRILIKPHPLSDVKRVIKQLGIQLNPDIFEITTRSLNEIVPESMAMIVKVSSSLFEALAVDIPVIVPSLYSIVDICPVSEVSDLAVYVSSSDDLVGCVQNLIRGKDVPAGNERDMHKSREFVKKYLHVLDKEEDYWNNLERAIKGLSSR